MCKPSATFACTPTPRYFTMMYWLNWLYSISPTLTEYLVTLSVVIVGMSRREDELVSETSDAASSDLSALLDLSKSRANPALVVVVAF